MVRTHIQLSEEQLNTVTLAVPEVFMALAEAGILVSHQRGNHLIRYNPARR